MSNQGSTPNINLILALGGAFLGYQYILKPIFEKTGIKDTAEEEEAKRRDQELENKGVWDTVAGLFKKYPKHKLILLKTEEADQIAKNIDSAWGIINDDEAKVYAQFRRLRYQSQVSSIVDAYRRLSNKDLLQTLKSNMSDSEVAIITSIVAQKPLGISK